MRRIVGLVAPMIQISVSLVLSPTIVASPHRRSPPWRDHGPLRAGRVDTVPTSRNNHGERSGVNVADHAPISPRLGLWSGTPLLNVRRAPLGAAPSC